MFLDSNRPIGIDLFAGAGGMSLGFEQAGFDVAAAVEIDPVHSAVHKFNFPLTKVICRTVVGLKAADIRIASGIGSRQIDCVFGGPPCQGFSLIGQRVLDDPRNNLVLEFVRLVAELDASSFVFENVKGLTVGKQRVVLEELIVAFEKAGYSVQFPWKVLDAAHFGAPQHRERLFLIGAKKGATLASFPTAICNAADDRRPNPELPVGPTCEDALGDLPDVGIFDTLLTNDSVRTKAFGKASNYAAHLRCLSNDAWQMGYVRNWNSESMTSSARTVHSEISQRRFSKTSPGQVEPISRFFKLAPKGLSNTLRAGTDGARGAFTSPRPIHYKFPRCITVREMGRLHGFPDWFRFHATKWHGARQIGNAVPPPLARAVAVAVLQSLELMPFQTTAMIELGEEALLYMGMKEAAEHFNVAPPNNRRDKKSGAKKRKQHEIEEESEQLQVIYG